MEVGEKVRYIGCDDEQIRWGGNDDPRSILEEGCVYTISDVDIHNFHTKVSFTGIDGKFNSVCFESI